jgi:hypothetical protein
MTTRRSARSRIISVGLLAVLLTGTVAATVTVRDLVAHQNRALLHERTAEAGLVLSSSVGSVAPTL